MARESSPKPTLKRKEVIEQRISPWTELALFCDNHYLKLTPRNKDRQNNQRVKAPIQQKCIEILRENYQLNWSDILQTKISENERRNADNYYYYLSQKWQESPVEVFKILEKIAREFVNILPEVIGDNTGEDLLKTNQFLDSLDRLNGSAEKTFFFLKILPEFLPKEAEIILTQSKGYKELIYWGASMFLKDFVEKFLEEFKITRRDIEQQTAQNLVRELGETETKLQQQIEWLEAENQELRETIEILKAESFEKAVVEFAQILQNQSQPTLDQIYRLHQKLKELEKTKDNFDLSHTDSLRVLIFLENLLKGLESVKLEYFPKNTEERFIISGEELGEYIYIDGSPFTEVTDYKEVKCISPGWRVGNQVITPAQVAEISVKENK